MKDPLHSTSMDKWYSGFPVAGIILVCDNCGKNFPLVPSDARARMKSKHVFHCFACRIEWLRKERVKG